MTSGMPDYFRGMRPRYGGAMKSTGTKVEAPLGYTSLITLSGRGMLYGGLVYLNHTSTQKGSEVIVKVDGRNMISMRFVDMNLLGVCSVGIYPTVLLDYDDVRFIYCVGLAGGVTFETSIEIVYNELHGSEPTVFAEMMYALIGME